MSAQGTRALAITAALALGLGGAIVVAAPANGASFTVTDPADTSTVGTLRYALENLAPGVTNTISIGPLGTITAATSLPDVTESVVITGPGESALTIEAPGTVLTLLGAGPNIDVTISGLTLASAGVNARGIYSDFVNLTVSDVTASNFSSIGISALNGAVSATNVTVENNDLGISAFGANAASPVTLTGIRASGAANIGVIVDTIGAAMSISDVRADDTGTGGLQATVVGGTATITDVHADRTGSLGAGIILIATTAAATSLTDSSAVDGLGQGVNVQLQSGASATIANVTSANNGSTGLSVTSVSGSVSLESSLIQGGLADSGVFANLNGGSFAITDSQIVGNRAVFGGGLRLYSVTGGTAVTLSNTEFSGNEAADEGVRSRRTHSAATGRA